GVRDANDGVQELALQNGPALSLKAQPGEEARHRVEIFDGDADVIEVPDRRHAVHPPVFVPQVRFSWHALMGVSAAPPGLPRMPAVGRAEVSCWPLGRPFWCRTGTVSLTPPGAR